MPSTLNLDFETYSEVDIKQVGAHRYAMDPSTEVLMAAYKINNGPVQLWDRTVDSGMPLDLADALHKDKYRIHAFNAQFERLILKHVLHLDLPPERFRCTMVHAYSLGFAGGLDTVAQAVGVPQDKQKLKIGAKLIQRFSKPAPKNHKADRYTRETHPAEWEEFKEYCRQDVITEGAALDYLLDYPMPAEQWRDWWMDQHISDRGVPVDLALIDAAIALDAQHREQLLSEMRELTGLENPNSREQLLEWIRTEHPEVPDLTAATVQGLLNDALSDRTRAVLERKQQIAQSSVSKYKKAKKAHWRGKVYGMTQFMGAGRTGRYAGRLLQLQNFKRPEMDVNLAVTNILNGSVPPGETTRHLTSSLRGMIKAQPGMKFSVSDLSGIEGRKLPWLCNYQQKLDMIENGLNMYLVAASSIYGTPYEDYLLDNGKVDKHHPEYLPGKVAELALGYQGASGALSQMGAAYGIEFEEDQKQFIVERWREANKPIVRFWYNTERAARRAINNPGDVIECGRVDWVMDGDFLFAVLPSGRELGYHHAHLENGRIYYMGQNSYTKKWEKIQTYGGKLVENITQGSSYDILQHGLRLIEKAGYRTLFTVHDEDVSENLDSGEFNEKELSQLLATQPAWAEGLPLSASGYDDYRYQK